jgi:hypothetical protein
MHDAIGLDLRDPIYSGGLRAEQPVVSPQWVLYFGGSQVMCQTNV